MPSIKEVFSLFKSQLSLLYDSNEAESIAKLTLNEVTGFSTARIKAFPEIELTPQQAASTFQILSELKTGKPIQYILGHTEFYGLPFKVNTSVLIPRPETEELVEWVISAVSIEKRESRNLLDIGTGSGCIAISLKNHLPDFDVTAMDISPEALQTAKENAELNKTAINFLEADILNPVPSTFFPKFEIIISNPPYVTQQDKSLMHKNVTDFEPHKALFVPENKPLLFYSVIADFALAHLKPGGLLFFEINEAYGEQLIVLLQNRGFSNIELKKDLSGRDRMIKATYELLSAPAQKNIALPNN